MSLFTKLFGLGESDHYNKGIEYYNRGEYDRAVVEFEKVIATITDTSDPYYQLGMFYAAETHAHLGFSFYKMRLPGLALYHLGRIEKLSITERVMSMIG